MNRRPSWTPVIRIPVALVSSVSTIVGNAITGRNHALTERLIVANIRRPGMIELFAVNRQLGVG